VARQGRNPVPPLIRVDAAFEEDWPGASASATECVLNTYVLAAMINRASLAWIRKEGLTSLTAFNLLTILQGAGEALQPSVIAERLMVSRGTLTGVMDTLERGGFLRREQHGLDGRGRLVALTEQGQDTVTQLRPRIHRAERSLVAGLTNEQQTLLIGLLAQMQDAATTLRFS
jgi:DNA-binding MarR family transcriptional regulator